MNLEWWHPFAAGAGVATLFLIDEPVRDFLQDHRSDGLNDLGDVTTHFKDSEVFWISGGSAIALGLITQEPKVTATGAHILAAYGISSWMMIGTKWAFGRSRPSETPDDPTDFDWFDGGENSAFPSGSAAVVFSLATTVADAVDRMPVSVVLYTGATLNAWARLNSDRHWLSDVVLGALYGVRPSSSTASGQSSASSCRRCGRMGARRGWATPSGSEACSRCSRVLILGGGKPLCDAESWQKSRKRPRLPRRREARGSGGSVGHDQGEKGPPSGARGES